MTPSTRAQEQQFQSSQWVASAAQAIKLIEQGATVLDVRNIVAWIIGHVPGAVRITWQQFSQQKPPCQGKLLEEPNLLAQKLCAVGVSHRKVVIVVGNPPHNFGEEGRIVWMLRTLGHERAAFVDGGYAALVKAGVPIVRGLRSGKNLTLGDFVAKPTTLWQIGRDELKANLATRHTSQKSIAIDTREAREYAGATPYGEQRGGHLPGAVHFYFKDLMNENGYLLPRQQIIAKLESLGIEPETAIAAYCTGGVRSAFFVAVLADLGFTNVKNYAGSMWEWSDAIAKDYPLNK